MHCGRLTGCSTCNVMLLLAFRYQVSAQTSSYVLSMLVLDPFPYPYLLPRQSRALCKCLQLKYYEQPITKQNHLPLHTHRNAGSEVSAGYVCFFCLLCRE
ncbi:hypothetical protein M440DRAFT_1062690 [Trichoderma longibrachiatum ATCC 18648]|uniref:Secreted protein n=1 Tax=Trichoderma longibrachiatum ATCC 18648 TaxID=983965 RepID=A0A2T4BVZ5_TRILO|nr:hypothetical protein M440DRAFT_1062690 [Trichoderma longibrachiatum ATCC 18648]